MVLKEDRIVIMIKRGIVMRLTERKVCYPQCDNQGNLTKVDFIEIKDKELATQKLCQLEDIEDDLGIDLIILFKALKDGAWTKFGNEISKCDECEYQFLDIYLYFYWNNGKHFVFFLKDYGKTWALTKEELL